MEIGRLIEERHAGMTVRTFLAKEMGLSTNLIQKILREREVYLNGTIPYVKDILKAGDHLTVGLGSACGSSDLEPLFGDIKIWYEDSWILAVDKPPFLPVHPMAGQSGGSLANMVRYWQMLKDETYAVRPVSRLDKNTSGIVLFAKNSFVQHALQQQSRNGLFIKEYLALVDGQMASPGGTITGKIDRKPDSIIERIVSENGKEAVTEYTLIKQYRRYALLRLVLHTGRTHQIRVHMKSIGHPVAGDGLYGSPGADFPGNRQCLHAFMVRFEHPVDNKTITIHSPMPEDIIRVIKKSM